jgi:hypothetical protein
VRYLAQRITTGEWIDRDLPLHDVTLTRDLSGPGGIQATISPELRRTTHTDGLRIFDEWSTVIYAALDNGEIQNAGIFVDASYEDGALTANCPGFTTYPHGYIYSTSRLWGPRAAAAAVPATATKPAVPAVTAIARPDPLKIVQDLWAYIQAQDDSNLGVTVVGTLASTVRVGTFAEPYRLRYFEVPDIGAAIDDLAEQTPFDYVEEHSWANTAKTVVGHRVRLGWPRLGTARTDLRFALGENIIETTPASTQGGQFANDVIGIGNGEGSRMVMARSTVPDGRLRRTRIVTDKTMQAPALQRLVTGIRAKSNRSLDITSVTIKNDENAPLSTIQPGDDIFVQTEIPAYGGDVRMWVRVTSITQDELGDTAVLTTSASNNFIYSSTIEVNQ